MTGISKQRYTMDIMSSDREQKTKYQRVTSYPTLYTIPSSLSYLFLSDGAEEWTSNCPTFQTLIYCTIYIVRHMKSFLNCLFYF